MGKIILRDGTVVELTEEQDFKLAKMIMYLPNHKLMKIAGATFSANDIDLEAGRLAKLPKQMGLAIEVKTVDKKRIRNME